MKTVIWKSRVMVILFLLLSACQPSPAVAPTQVAQSSPEVIIQGSALKEEVQTIEIDNCSGKSDLTRTEQRTQSVDVTISTEVAARIGASVQIIAADVQAAVSASRTTETSRMTGINLTAPPGSRMVFQLSWTGNEQIGVVQNIRGSTIPIAFRGFTPTDVRIKNQNDIGCPNSSKPIPVVTVVNPTAVHTNEPTATVTRPILPTQSSIPATEFLIGTWEYQKTRQPMPDPAKPGQVIVAHGDIDNSGTCHLKVFQPGQPIQGLGNGTFQLWLITGTPDYVETAIANHQKGAAMDAGGSCPRIP